MEEDEWDDALLSEITALETRHLQQHSAQNSSTSVITPISSSSWSCNSCTLENEGTRGTCLVCSTPRGRLYQVSPAKSTDSAKTKVQTTLFFDRTAVSEAGVAPLQLSQPRDQHQTTESERKTSRRSTSDAVSATSSTLSSLTVPRHAVGEDFQAKTRYLDIEMSSKYPRIDLEAAQYFVYPTNYSIRDYQLTIAEKALYHNTLVSLPTGLGKTLVAAVVMYNFYRWFPTGKIVFMAPTKPLVAQQIKACHEIMGIPLSDTAELQGNVPPTMRRVLWHSKRVFFCTPQSLQNDLRRGVCAAEKFVCIVVDEAHRATGNYAYCCVVEEIETKTRFFRVLALSATPGAKFDVIQDVVTNLRISHIESRSADDPDVKKYTHVRQEEVIVCHLGTKLTEVKTQFLKCFTPILQRLVRNHILQHGDPEKLTSWYVLQARETFRKSPQYASNRSAECDLALLVSLLHAKSLLTGHGLSSFRDQIVNWVQERQKGKLSWSKREMLLSSDFQALESSLAVSTGTDSSIETASHPKLVKLRTVLLDHFERHAKGQSGTRAIVFTQYRASVSEIVALLRPLAPLLNVQPFIGQGTSGKGKENKGQSQKVQQAIVRRFRSGEFNVLVATCIAEEGLDIGEVDLIVSFDALTSPVRMIQRMGRTGRKRVGRVIILVTEGEEQRKLARSASAAKTVSRALTTFKSKFTYSQCPRMLPDGICPKLRELAMIIPTFHASQVGGKTASGTIDPSLWQLSDVERTEAVKKYFPLNYAANGRKKLYPVVANRTPLLRSQPRVLMMGKSGGTRVGYSSRSLILLALVRKIHNIEEELEANVDEIEEEMNVEDARGKVDDGVGSIVAVSSELDDRKEDEESFASLNTFDMHFSPPVVADLATQSVEDGVQNNTSGLANGGEAQSLDAVCSEEEKSHQTSSASSLTSVAGSPSLQAIVSHQTSVKGNDSSSLGRDAGVYKLSSTRQLQFDEEEELEEEDVRESKTESVIIEENQDEKVVFGDSFALLPPIDVKNESKGRTVKLRERNWQAIDDSTDGDEVEEIIDVESTVKDEVECITDTGTSFIETPKQETTRIAESKSDAVTLEATQKSPSSMDESCCAICLEDEPFDDDPIVFCDGCDVPVHQFCYGINVVPRATWFCDSCVEARKSSTSSGSSEKQLIPRDCDLCPLRGGALKRTLCGKWVHVQCFLWIPELGVEKREDELLVLGKLDSLDVDRKTLECSLCHSSKGNGIIQCAYKRCLSAFHVSCAAFARYRMDQVDPPQGEDSGGGTMFLVYCSLHRHSKAPVPLLKQQQQMSLSATTESITTTETSSPSHLLTSPPSIEVKKKFKTFRRLKRKYEATQSQQFSPGGKQESSSPWQKRIQRSKRRRETARVLAAAYIEETVEVRGAQDEDEDEEEEDGDDIDQALEDSFINDSSQLLYTQSLVSPEAHDDVNTTKKKRNKMFSPDMRAIYARSLVESQSTPFLQRRRGRQFSALPLNGIIRSCLEALDDEKSPRRCEDSEDTVLMTTPSASFATVDEADEAVESPSFHLLGATEAFEPRALIEQEEAGTTNIEIEEEEVSTPSFKLLEAVKTFPGAADTSEKESKCLPDEASCQKDNVTMETELHWKIESNRLKALKKLEERRQLKRHRVQGPERNEWILVVSSTFASSCLFPTFRSTKHSTCVVAIDDSLEADTLLSVRVAVYFVSDHELQDLARASFLAPSRRIERLVSMHKKLLVALVYSGSELPGLRVLQQLPNVEVILEPTIESLCQQLHQLAHQERAKGYELPSPSVCRSEASGGELDAAFASRLEFFRSFSPLSLDSALSLSFRFKNFTATQVPVLRFNVMHWRRMLPWISESTAQAIQTYVKKQKEHEN